MPYTQQNGVAERNNGSLIEMGRILLQPKGTLTVFWVEVIASSNKFFNRVFIRVVWDLTLEKWSGRKPSIEHIRTFGCRAWAHILMRSGRS
jgi:hypothetical protein